MAEIKIIGCRLNPAIASFPGRAVDNLTTALKLGPDTGDRGVVNTEHLTNPAAGSVRRFPKLIRNQLPFLFRAEVPSSEVEGSGQSPLFLLFHARLNDFRTVVAEFRSDLLVGLAFGNQLEHLPLA